MDDDVLDPHLRACALMRVREMLSRLGIPVSPHHPNGDRLT
jgi:hypothetical protein